MEVAMRPMRAAMGAGLLAVAAAVAVPAGVSAAPLDSHVTGTLPDGASWVADCSTSTSRRHEDHRMI
jgi:hypothetical protein